MQALGELTVRAYRALGDQAIDDDYAAELGDVGGRAAQVPVLVAVEDGRLLGGVTYVPGPGPFAEIEGTNEAGIRMLAVDAEHEGRGAGQALVEACLAHAREAGKDAVVLLTTPRMHRAHRLYERLGFVRTPERDWWPFPGLELHCYSRQL